MVKKTLERLSSILPLTLAAVALVALGCPAKKNRVRALPEAPQKAAIESAIQSYEKHKKNGDVAVPISELQDGLRMLVNSWGNYEYARKELAKQAVTINEIRTVTAVDLQVAAGQVQQAQAERDKHRRHFWYAVGAGIVAAALGFLVGAIAF